MIVLPEIWLKKNLPKIKRMPIPKWKIASITLQPAPATTRGVRNSSSKPLTARKAVRSNLVKYLKCPRIYDICQARETRQQSFIWRAAVKQTPLRTMNVMQSRKKRASDRNEQNAKNVCGPKKINFVSLPQVTKWCSTPDLFVVFIGNKFGSEGTMLLLKKGTSPFQN